MDACELKTSYFLAAILANYCHEESECPAGEYDVKCPFYGVPCMEVPRKNGSLGQPNKRTSMDAQREKNKALFLARILAHTCRDERSCPAAAVGMECPFTGRCFCDDITSTHWYAYASKKGN